MVRTRILKLGMCQQWRFPLLRSGFLTNKCINDTAAHPCNDGCLDLNFLHDIVEFALALDSLNADISECECNKYCFPEIGG